jgi:HK97 family phage major capsid protein
MKTIPQYKKEIKDAMDVVSAITAKAATENRDLTVDEVGGINEINAKIKTTQDMVAALEDSEVLNAAMNAPAAPVTTERRPAMSAVQADKEKFKTIGEQLFAVMKAGVPGGHADPRLFNAATGLNETVPSDGGFLVQQDFSNELLEQVYQTGVLAPRCRRMQISGNSNSIKLNGVDETSRASTRFGGVVGYWKDEASEKTASKPKFRQIELSLKKLIGLCYATDELLADSTALESFIRKAFPAEFGFLLDDAIINGNGAGQPLGILNAGCLVSVGKETGQKADTLLWENVVKMYSRLFAQSRNNAVWLINQNVEPQLMQMSMAVGTGGVPVYMPAGGASQSPYATLFGRPVIAIEQCQTLGDKGDIIFADLGGYILAEKGGIQADMSIHVQFKYDESVFRFVMRVDGQPERASALTPYKGSDTLSHFVTLDARA